MSSELDEIFQDFKKRAEDLQQRGENGERTYLFMADIAELLANIYATPGLGNDANAQELIKKLEVLYDRVSFSGESPGFKD